MTQVPDNYAIPQLTVEARADLLDTASIALTLSAVTRLKQCFYEESTDMRRNLMLQAAAEQMDRTVSSETLRKLMLTPENMLLAKQDALALLVPNRNEMALVPPGLWPHARISPNLLGETGYRGWRALTRVQRADLGNLPALRAALVAWLAPAWEAHPELEAEAMALLSRDSI